MGGLWILFSRAETVASPEAKTAITSWLKNVKPEGTLSNWRSTFASVFDSIFGKKHLSRRCFRRSCVASVISVVTLMILWATMRPQQIWSYLDDPHFWTHNFGVLFATLWLNFLPDYFSLLETRYAIGLMQRAHSWARIVLILIADLIATTLIAFSAFLAFLGFWYMMAGHEPDYLRWLVYDFVSHGIFLDATNYRGVPFGVWFYSTFFTSVWVWLYAISGLVVKLAGYLSIGFNRLKWFLDIENKPLQSLGIISMVLVTLIYLGVGFYRLVGSY